MEYGDVATKRHDEPWAERWYRTALSLNRNHVTLRSLGETLVRQGRFAEAKRHLRRAIGLARLGRQDDAIGITTSG